MRLALLLVFIVTNAFSQEFRKFRTEFGFGNAVNYSGYQQASGNASLAYFAPAYRLNDKMIVGFKMEVAIGSTITIGSYGPTFQYYFSNNPFRLFAGGGIGLYHPGLSSGGGCSPGPYNSSPHSTDEGTSLGFYPRVGFDWRHITVTFDYNIVANSKVQIHDNPSSPLDGTNANLNSNYLGLKLGIFIGGGRKKK